MTRKGQSRWDSNMGLQSHAIAEVTQGFLLSIYASNLYISKSHEHISSFIWLFYLRKEIQPKKIDQRTLCQVYPI